MSASPPASRSVSNEDCVPLLCAYAAFSSSFFSVFGAADDFQPRVVDWNKLVKGVRKLRPRTS